MNPVASIDLGSNTVRLIVAKKKGDGFERIFENQLITRLGQGASKTGTLSESAIARTVEALARFKKQSDNYGAQEVWVAATSAVRLANNSEDFIDTVRSKTGLCIEVIPWEEEGRQMLRGVSYGLRGDLKKGVVFDIGGGSTEFIVTDGLKVIKSAGSTLGVVRLAEKHISRYPVSPVELSSLHHEISEIVQNKKKELSPGEHVFLTGTAGTVTTIAALDMKLFPYDPEKINGHVIAKESVEGLIQKIKNLSLEQVLQLPQIEKGREDLILPGLLIVLETMKIFGTTELTASDFGLREGILIDRLFPET